MKRREFLKTSLGLGIAGVAAGRWARFAAGGDEAPAKSVPIVISTWKHGVAANEAAYAVLVRGGSALDAVEQGVRVSEADPKVTSVGFGGLPNAEGVVELDAAIMEGRTRNAGAVAALQGIMHPVSVARKVMETTPHVLIVGAGAKRFALQHGFPEENLLTPESRAAWERWKAGNEPVKSHTPGDHDTIGMIAIDRAGDIAASCTTSGLAWKLPGRVGDSPLAGHGLYCENGVGGAAATGVGEEIIKVCGSYHVVDLMRQGRSAQEAVEAALGRVLARSEEGAAKMVAFIALRADGTAGFASTLPGFQAAVSRAGKHDLLDARSLATK